MDSDQIFKRIIRVIMKAGNRDTCRPLFKAGVGKDFS
jgi:hypothetical protein